MTGSVNGCTSSSIRWRGIRRPSVCASWENGPYSHWSKPSTTRSSSRTTELPLPSWLEYGECLILLARTGSPSAEAHIRTALKSTNKRVVEKAAEAKAVLQGVSAPMERVFERMDEVGFENLTEAERTVASVRMLIDEVNNGGFWQYFFNSSGDYVGAALEGLIAIGARETEKALLKATNLFGGQGPSENRDSRIGQLEELSKKTQARLRALDDAFYKDPDGIEAKLFLFIAQNKESFPSRRGRGRPPR